ncbi:MAG: 30S ribosomal protein S8 [Halobacteriales archaeon]|nr:30S ribosomal protein S8 [Halobacteriales archaeon]
MTRTDPLADALSTVKNGDKLGKLDCTVEPASNVVGNVLGVLYDEGYIDSFEFVENGKAGEFHVDLAGQINDCGVVKPRYSTTKDEYEKWEKRYLPGRDFGSLIVTTSHGVMTHYEAREKGVGGQLLAYVY